MKILIRNSDNAVIYAQGDLQLDAEAHGDGWRDPNFNTANARIDDADLPEDWRGAEWSYEDGEWTLVAADAYAARAAEDLARRVSAVVRKIDADADLIYTAALGNRATEYAQAEADATVYKDAGYAGSVPGYVQAWATATGKAAHWAADDILATAQGWRDAQAQIRLNRLSRKELARKATTATELDTVRTQWAAFVVAIRSQLRI